ncbi:MAG: hypothetical protein DRN30_02660 [Thermoplasmata archaeon]|nr:MAG: hypothetical protein DRN30_02660 [Thermoplasmata archaeon]
MNELDRAMLEGFIEEVTSILERISELISLKNIKSEHIDELFRLFHTLKGLFASVGFDKTKDLIHKYEDLLSEYKNKKVVLNDEDRAQLSSIVNLLESIVSNIESGEEPFLGEIEELISRFERRMQTEEVKEIEDIKTQNISKRKTSRGIKIMIKIDPNEVLVAAKMLIILKHLKDRNVEFTLISPDMKSIEEGIVKERDLVIEASREKVQIIKDLVKEIPGVVSVVIEEEQATEQKEAAASTMQKKAEALPKTIRVDSEKLDRLLSIVENLTVLSNRLIAIASNTKNDDLISVVNLISKAVGELREEVLSLRLIPISYLFSKIPRIAYDLASKLGKKIEVTIEGGDVEIDKASLEKLHDPIIHIVRNAVDHGIEPPNERITKGKPEKGRIIVRARRSPRGIVIEVSDDGRGIDIEKIKRKALERGLVTQDKLEKMSREDLFSFLFIPGFSTSDKVTDVSGRGVGLDVVKNVIESLGGYVELQSELGKGTTIRMVLPPTTLIVKALIIRSGNIRWAIPVDSIISIQEISDIEVREIASQKVVVYRNSFVPLLSLSRIFGLEDENENIVMVCGKEKKIALRLAEVIRHMDIVVKPVPSVIRGFKGITGVTILEDGFVAPVIDPEALVRFVG